MGPQLCLPGGFCVHCLCRQSPPLYCHRVIPIHDLIYYTAALSSRRIGWIGDQEQQSEIHVGFNGEFYRHMDELVLFSQKPLHAAKERKKKSLGIIFMYCASNTKWLWLVIKALLSERSDRDSG